MEPPIGCTCIKNTIKQKGCGKTEAKCGFYGYGNKWCFVSDEKSCLDKIESNCGGFYAECKQREGKCGITNDVTRHYLK